MKPVIVLNGGLNERLTFLGFGKRNQNIYNIKSQFDDGERFEISVFDEVSYYAGILNTALQKTKDFIFIHDLKPSTITKLRDIFDIEIYSVYVSNNQKINQNYDFSFCLDENAEKKIENFLNTFK